MVDDSKIKNVVKRNGSTQRFSTEKLKRRIMKCAEGLDVRLSHEGVTSSSDESFCVVSEKHINASYVIHRLCEGLYDEVPTKNVDEELISVCAFNQQEHPDIGILAGRLVASGLWKVTPTKFSEAMYLINSISSHSMPETSAVGLLATEMIDFVRLYEDRLNAAVVSSRDLNFDYFGMQTLLHSYVTKPQPSLPHLPPLLETPQYLFMRVACGIHFDDIEATIGAYNYMSQKYYIHATPTLFFAGYRQAQLASCFLMPALEDTVPGVMETVSRVARISARGGGIGLSLHNIRTTGAFVEDSQFSSKGLLPVLKLLNATCRFAEQGGGRRKGAFAVYLEPWHNDIFQFLDIRKNFGKDDSRTRDLFIGLWTPDLFMQRVESDSMWSLFNPQTAPGLSDCWGNTFASLYTKYEENGLAIRCVKARTLWQAITDSQIETGAPYILFKDTINMLSNHQHRGCIQLSNLCAEIVQYSSDTEVAVCNLASLALPSFVITPDDFSVHSVQEKAPRGVYDAKLDEPIEDSADRKRDASTTHCPAIERFDFSKLAEVTRFVVRSLDKVIDISKFAVEGAHVSNELNRAMGIGVQGFATLFRQLRIPFDSSEALTVNRQIFETIYFAALQESCALAKQFNSYPTYRGSPASRGLLQTDLWAQATGGNRFDIESSRHDWASLRADIAVHGLRNSLLIAIMPTASTSQILGNTEGVEPLQSNMFRRSVAAGEFVVVNTELLKDLFDRGLWNVQMKQRIMSNGGSVQNIPEIPTDLKGLYKTTWEMSQRTVIDLAAGRAPYVDQSQSMSLSLALPTSSKLTSAIFYAWRKKLKTGIYYLRTRSAQDPIPFTIPVSIVRSTASAKVRTQQTKTVNGLTNGRTDEVGISHEARRISSRSRTMSEERGMPETTTTTTTTNDIQDEQPQSTKRTSSLTRTFAQDASCDSCSA